MRRAVLFAGLLLGCGPSAHRRPQQDLAERVAWHGTLGMSRPPPPTEWIMVTGWEGPGSEAYGVTLAPLGIRVACLATVEWAGHPDGSGCDLDITDSAYAHELVHWKHWLETGDVDPTHSFADWGLPLRADGDLRAAGVR